MTVGLVGTALVRVVDVRDATAAMTHRTDCRVDATITPPGRAALAEALREATSPGEEVILRPAVRHTPAPDPTDLGAEFATDLTSLTAAGGSVVVDHGDLADPSDSVVQIAQRRDARLIVVGLRHRTPVGRMLLGSTAQRILLDATRPVLAVKAVRHRDDQLAAEVRSFRAGSMATRM